MLYMCKGDNEMDRHNPTSESLRSVRKQIVQAYSQGCSMISTRS